jgi:hypothetical protein
MLRQQLGQQQVQYYQFVVTWEVKKELLADQLQSNPTPKEYQ